MCLPCRTLPAPRAETFGTSGALARGCRHRSSSVQSHAGCLTGTKCLTVHLQERWRADARAVLAAQSGLNDSQRQAVAAALTQTVTLWQGPPGTGKTRTLLALVEVRPSPNDLTTAVPLL